MADHPYRPPVNHFGNASGAGGGGGYGGGGGGGRRAAAPKGYVAGLGRGAAGFTTRSDLGPMGASSVGGAAGAGEDGAGAAGGSGSRSAELRQAKMRMQQQQQQQGQVQGAVAQPSPSPFGVAPAGYVAGMGRGAGPGAGAGAGRGEGGGGGNKNKDGPTGLPHPSESYDQFSGYSNQRRPLFDDAPYDPDDEEADAIYASIDKEREQQKSKRKKRKKGDGNGEDDKSVEADGSGSTMMKEISSQFRDLKQQLAGVSKEQWMAIPDAGDSSLRRKNKQLRQEQFSTSITSDLLLADRLKANRDATAGGDMNIAANTFVMDGTGTSTSTATLQSMAGLSSARGTVLNMSLDKYTAGNSNGQSTANGGGGGAADGTGTSTIGGTTTTIDPKGYLTSLSSVKIASDAEIGDIHKARLLLKSVRDTNPHHGPGWIASARVEEAANNLMQARKLIQQACQECPQNEDVWLEAARLHSSPPQQAKTILATAVRRMLPKSSVKIFLKAADLEHTPSGKKAVLRKALEAMPTSVTLWKAAIDLEDSVEDAKVLLGVAVEKVPTSVELWLALSRLESYENARKVLNQARKKLPMDRSIWMAAAKLEESQQQPFAVISKIIEKAVHSLMVKHEAAISREQWLQEAEAAERAGAPLTSKTIVEQTIGLNVEDLDRQRTWSDDATRCLANGHQETARSILAHALKQFPTRKRLWWQAVELERHHGTASALDEVLEAACQRLPEDELFWLVRAKEQWSTQGNVDKARAILTEAFKQNSTGDSEEIWLAAAKLEWESSELDRARVLLERARDRAPTPRVYMKSALLERQTKNLLKALELIDTGLSKYPTFAKLYMMGGQICSDDLVSIDRSHNGGDNAQIDAIDAGADVAMTEEEKKSNGDSSDGNPAIAVAVDFTKWRDRAREYYQVGMNHCPTNVTLWILASLLEERIAKHEARAASAGNGNGNGSSNSAEFDFDTGTLYTKARSLLELARLKNPKNPTLWIEAVRLERRAGNDVQANTLLAKALQECPQSGLLLSETIVTAAKPERKSKSAQAIQRCPEDPHVIVAVARLFASERSSTGKQKQNKQKARKWFERAITLDQDLGDAWAHYYAFERLQEHGNGKKEQQQPQISVKERCVKAAPTHGEVWCRLTKQVPHRHKSIGDKLELVAQYLLKQKQQQSSSSL
jgi:pre-mRNA-processing factor 6